MSTNSLQSAFITRREFIACAASSAAGLGINLASHGHLLAAETYKPVEFPQVPRPKYLESITDPVFGSKITRITGDPGTVIPNIDAKWDSVARHLYSKDAAWNADGTLLSLKRHHGFPAMLFLDGETYQPLFGRNTSPGAEVRWHPARPDTKVFVKDNAIGYWHVREDKTEVIARFDGYSNFHIGPWEGNLSSDGKRIVVDGMKNGQRVAFAYDLAAKQKWPDISGRGTEVDWFSISASGKLIVLNGKISGSQGDQTQVFDLEGNKVGELWQQRGRPSHYDLTVDEHGDDIAVGVSKSKPDDGRVISRRLKDGKVTVLTPGGYASHISTRNSARPGWAYATYQHRGPTWPPFWDEVIAVKLDGSMTVERIAHLHTKTTDYLTEAHAVPSPDGKRVLWASNWEAESGRPVGAYIADTRGVQKYD